MASFGHEFNFLIFKNECVIFFIVNNIEWKWEHKKHIDQFSDIEAEKKKLDI